MLKAILHGKSARVKHDHTDKDVSWRELFKTREDLLTSAFFGRIPYLSDDSLNYLMAALLGSSTDDGKLLGDYIRMEFWPRLASPHVDRRYVEPDLLMYFEKAIVLIEVKPPTQSQSVIQWHHEIQAVVNDQDINSLYFLALGGRQPCIDSECAEWIDDFKDQNLSIRTCSWKKVSHSLDILLNRTKCKTDKHVLKDQLSALGLFDIKKPAQPLHTLLALSDIYDLDGLTSFPKMKRRIRRFKYPVWSGLLAYTEAIFEPKELSQWK